LAAVRQAATGADAKAAGAVRLTSLPFLIDNILAERVPELLRRHPDLRLELAASSSNAYLSRREADIALRFARPRAGGDIVCRRLAVIEYAVFAPQGAAGRARPLPWIAYDEELSDLPEASWIRRRAAQGEAIAASATGIETMRRLASAGAGRILIPVFAGAADHGLARCSGKILEREVWLLVHRDMRALARVAAVVDWAAESFRLKLS
jgi:DNA-binding transcriptional LysR family regulator